MRKTFRIAHFKSKLTFFALKRWKYRLFSFLISAFVSCGYVRQPADCYSFLPVEEMNNLRSLFWLSRLILDLPGSILQNGLTF